MKISRKRRFAQLIDTTPSVENLERWKQKYLKDDVIAIENIPYRALFDKLSKTIRELEGIVDLEIRCPNDDLTRQQIIMEISTVVSSIKNIINKSR